MINVYPNSMTSRTHGRALCLRTLNNVFCLEKKSNGFKQFYVKFDANNTGDYIIFFVFVLVFLF